MRRHEVSVDYRIARPFFDEGEVRWIRSILKKLITDAAFLSAGWADEPEQNGLELLN
jgi:hypothetical protein